MTDEFHAMLPAVRNACESKISGRVNNKKRGPWEENHGRARPVILPRASSSASKGSIRKMRVPRAFLFLALVASLTSTAYAQGAPHPLTSPWHVIFIISYPAAPFSPRIVGPCARARDIPSRVAPTRCIFRDRDRSRRGRLGRTPIPVVQHPPPPAGPPNEPEFFQLFLTGKYSLLSPSQFRATSRALSS